MIQMGMCHRVTQGMSISMNRAMIAVLVYLREYLGLIYLMQKSTRKSFSSLKWFPLTLSQ